MKTVTHSCASGGWVLALHESINALQDFIWTLPFEALLAQFLHCLFELLKRDGSGVLGPGQLDRNQKLWSTNALPSKVQLLPHSDLSSFVLSVSVSMTKNSIVPGTLWCLVGPLQMFRHMNPSMANYLALSSHSHPHIFGSSLDFAEHDVHICGGDHLAIHDATVFA